jgi:hypothetical protein
MTAQTSENAERAARRAETIINLALETTVGAAIGGGGGIAVALLVPPLVATAPLTGTVTGIVLGILLGRWLLGAPSARPSPEPEVTILR